MVKVIPLKYGTIFKQVFGRPEVFKAFTQDVLGLEFNITQVEKEYEYPQTIGYVKTRYDLFAEDESNRAIVEIQNVKEDDFFDRFLYYHLISLAEQVKGYKAYGFDRAVYTIVVLTSVPQNGSVNFSVAVSDMNPITELGETVSIYPHRLVFLTPRLVNDQTPAAIRDWLELIKDSLDEQVDETHYSRPLFQDIITSMKATTISPEALSEIKDEMAWEQAKARFRQEAWGEGKLQGKLEVAQSLLDVLDDETISLKTGLPLAQIQELRAAHS